MDKVMKNSIRDHLIYLIKLLKSPDYKDFREDVKKFREDWLKYNGYDSDLLPVDLDDEMNLIFQNHLPLGFENERFYLMTWQKEMKEKLGLDKMIEDLKNGSIDNYKNYKKIIEYEMENHKNNKYSIFKFYNDLKSMKYLYFLKSVEEKYLYQIYNWLHDYLDTMIKNFSIYDKLLETKFDYSLMGLNNYIRNKEMERSKVLEGLKKLDFKSKNTNKTVKEDKTIKDYCLLKESYTWNESDLKRIKLKINKANFDEMKNERIYNYKKLLGYVSAQNDCDELIKPLIIGFKENKKVIIDDSTTNDNLKNRFYNLISKWSYKSYIMDVRYDIDENFKRLMKLSNQKSFDSFGYADPKRSSFYSFLSCCIIFNMDSINDLSRCFRPVKKELINLRNLISEFKTDKTELIKIKTMINSDDMNKEEIKNKINSASFRNKLRNQKKNYFDKQPPVYAYPGILPTKTVWKELYELKANEVKTAQKMKGISYISLLETYEWNLDLKNNSFKSRNEQIKFIRDKYKKRNVESRIEKHCKKLELADILLPEK